MATVADKMAKRLGKEPKNVVEVKINLDGKEVNKDELLSGALKEIEDSKEETKKSDSGADVDGDASNANDASDVKENKDKEMPKENKKLKTVTQIMEDEELSIGGALKACRKIIKKARKAYADDVDAIMENIEPFEGYSKAQLLEIIVNESNSIKANLRNKSKYNKQCNTVNLFNLVKEEQYMIATNLNMLKALKTEEFSML